MNLYQHQKEALELTKDFPNVAFFHDMGLGKTYTGSEAMFRFQTNSNLVICQKSKVQDWINHFTENYDVQVFNCTIDTGLDDFLGQCILDRKVNVGIINYELAWRRKDLKWLENFTLMLDESSLIQNPSAKQTKFIMKLKPSHVILLSGSPVGGKYENLWTQSKLLGWNISDKVFDKTYVNRTPVNVGINMTRNLVNKEDPYKNTERLKRKLKQHGAVFLKTEEVMDLPEQNFIQVKVPKTKEYIKFMKKKIIQIGDQELVGDTSLTKLLYARQLCGQFNEDKLQAFRDLVESTHERLIVFYNFTAELKAMEKVIPDGRWWGVVNGQQKDLAPYDTVEDSITFIQYQAGSMGLNLQKSCRIIYFSLPLSSELFEQSKKRIHRIGQDHPCFYYLMIAEGSVEEQILQTLEQRKDFTDALFN